MSRRGRPEIVASPAFYSPSLLRKQMPILKKVPLYQKMMSIFTSIISSWGVTLVALNIALFELPPAYLCKYVDALDDTGEFTCERDLFCDNPTVTWRVDWDQPRSLHNWVGPLDLHCASSLKIGILGTSFFSGLAFGFIVFPRYADIYGRRPLLFL